MMNFEITDLEQANIYQWLWDYVYPEVIAYQKLMYPNPSEDMVKCWDQSRPFVDHLEIVYGNVEYTFRPKQSKIAKFIKYENMGLVFEKEIK